MDIRSAESSTACKYLVCKYSGLIGLDAAVWLFCVPMSSRGCPDI
ncbi:hypothetical protein HMPREF1546_02307 [Oscillibacter sp. KLE 1745]|nr:hypothetical protein HMPREF1546_02307 [Oscillibacter sp. KLE 1745]